MPQEIFPGEVFANTADFDIGIRQLLPRYDEMLDAIARLIPKEAQQILDLGCGTGELSLKLLKRCPSAKLVAVDYSPRMLKFAQAKINASGYSDRWTGIIADFGDWANNSNTGDIGTGFDACVSSLAIHHLTDEMKLKLFERIYQSLTQSGLFWNGDPTLPESETLAAVFKGVREDWVIEQGTTLAEIRAKLGTSINYGYSNPDQLATVNAHLQMLTKAGFKLLAIPWKYYQLTVFGGFVSTDG